MVALLPAVTPVDTPTNLLNTSTLIGEGLQAKARAS
jgi:hypothetical protein